MKRAVISYREGRHAARGTRATRNPTALESHEEPFASDTPTAVRRDEFIGTPYSCRPLPIMEPAYRHTFWITAVQHSTGLTSMVAGCCPGPATRCRNVCCRNIRRLHTMGLAYEIVAALFRVFTYPRPVWQRWIKPTVPLGSLLCSLLENSASAFRHRGGIEIRPEQPEFAEPNRTKSNSELFRERATEELEII